MSKRKAVKQPDVPLDPNVVIALVSQLLGATMLTREPKEASVFIAGAERFKLTLKVEPEVEAKP